MFPQIPVQPSIECTRTDTLHYDPIRSFGGTCHKTQSQTNRHPSIDPNIRHGRPFPPSISLIITCALNPSLRDAVGPPPLLIGGACSLLRSGYRRQWLRWSTVFSGSECHPNWGADGGGGVEAQDIGLSYGWGLLWLFQSCCRYEEVREEEGQEEK